jgi:hypothetical protein
VRACMRACVDECQCVYVGVRHALGQLRDQPVPPAARARGAGPGGQHRPRVP